MNEESNKKMTDEKFLWLCAMGTVDEVLAAIKAGANVNAEGWRGFFFTDTPMTACLLRYYEHGEHEGPELIMALLDAGVDVNVLIEGLVDELDDEASCFNARLTPLSAAVIFGMSGLIKPLLDKGADPNAWIFRHTDFDDEDYEDYEDNFVQGPLLCFITDRIFQLYYLYKETEDVSRYIEMMKLLLNAGADINAADENGRTPLRIILEKKEGDECKDSRFIVEIADFLMEARADTKACVKPEKPQRSTLLGLSAIGAEWFTEREDGKILSRHQYLLNIGADVNERNTKGQTPLMMAVAYIDIGYVSTLLKNGADVNLRDAKGRTALVYMYADVGYFDDEANDNPYMVDALVKAGADVNAADDDGMTVLMYAAEQSTWPDAEVLTALLNAGADPAVRDKLGLCAYDYAMKNKALRGVIDFASHTFSILEKAAAASSKSIDNH